jgi:DNA-binding transcriptional LysR family regulator
VATELAVQEIFAICPPGTRLSKHGTLVVERLAEGPLVTTLSGTSTRRLADQALASGAIETRVAVETGQHEAILPLVLAGGGTSFVAGLSAPKGPSKAPSWPAGTRHSNARSASYTVEVP